MRRRGRSGQLGQETLQAILVVAFMLLPVLFGIIEMGGLIHIWIGQQSAAAVGARLAGEQGEDDSLVRTRIAAELQAGGVSAGAVRITITPGFVHWGEPITVQLISHHRVAIPFLFSRDVTLSSTYVGRGEVNH